jgi:superfamily II helicase
LFGGAATWANAASKLNVEALRNLFDLSESLIQIVPTCVFSGMLQALCQFWRFDMNRSSRQSMEICHTCTKVILKQMRRFSGLILVKHLESGCVCCQAR